MRKELEKKKYRPVLLDIDLNFRFLPIYCFRKLEHVRYFFKAKVDQVLKNEKIKYGAGTEFGENVCIEGNVEIGKNCFVGTNAIVRHDAVIGDNTIIGNMTVIEEGVKIGEDSTIQNGCYITMGVVVESNVFIGPCVVTTNDAPMVKYHPERGKFIPKGPVFKKGCSVGAGSVILPGITIGENAVVGAGSVVTKSVPDGEVWYGDYAKCKSGSLRRVEC